MCIEKVYSNYSEVTAAFVCTSQVQDVVPITSCDTAGSFLLLGCNNGSIYYIGTRIQTRKSSSDKLPKCCLLNCNTNSFCQTCKSFHWGWKTTISWWRSFITIPQTMPSLHCLSTSRLKPVSNTIFTKEEWKIRVFFLETTTCKTRRNVQSYWKFAVIDVRHKGWKMCNQRYINIGRTLLIPCTKYI